jgi:hypothetical protein
LRKLIEFEFLRWVDEKVGDLRSQAEEGILEVSPREIDKRDFSE